MEYDKDFEDKKGDHSILPDKDSEDKKGYYSILPVSHDKEASMATVIHGQQYLEQTEQSALTQPNPQETQGSKKYIYIGLSVVALAVIGVGASLYLRHRKVQKTKEVLSKIECESQ
jgi:hypothetical protein